MQKFLKKIENENFQRNSESHFTWCSVFKFELINNLTE